MTDEDERDEAEPAPEGADAEKSGDATKPAEGAEPGEKPDPGHAAQAEKADASAGDADDAKEADASAGGDEPDAKEADAAAADAEADAEKADASTEDDEPADAAESSDVPSQPAPKKKAPSVEVDPQVTGRKPAAWGLPFVRIDSVWTKWEVILCTSVLVLEVLVLSLWVGLKGLSTAAGGASNAGIVFRMLAGASVLGGVGFLATRKQKKPVQRAMSIGGIVIGIATAKYWGNVGVEWASNMLNWFQQASTLTLFGGLRGLGTRLTLVLALVGGSLATASGKHINIDLITRFLRPRARLYVVVVGWLSTAFIVGVAGWGFFDHIAIDDFDAKAEARPSEKLSEVTKGMGEHAFMLRKQIGLDLKALPHVLKGERYAEWLGADEWNSWVRDGGFAERYGPEKAKLLEITPDMKRSPIVVIPEKGEPRGELIKSANLAFPFGLFVLVFRFVLLSLLALSGHFTVTFEAAADEIKRKHEEREGGDDGDDDSSAGREQKEEQGV
jgi:hypothetical protein